MKRPVCRDRIGPDAGDDAGKRVDVRRSRGAPHMGHELVALKKVLERERELTAHVPDRRSPIEGEDALRVGTGTPGRPGDDELQHDVIGRKRLPCELAGLC